MSPCPDENTILNLTEGRLPPDVAAQVESHVDTCAACAVLLVDLGRIYVPEGEALATTQIGRYEVHTRLGVGAMGVVYAAYDPALDRRVALKVLHAREGHDRLAHEARALARLQHPNVVAVHDVGTCEGRPFLTMDLLDGGTLRDWRARDPRSVDDVLSMYLAAGRGLAAAHAQGIVHRDFKPENVLVGSDGAPRVTDFGLARTAAPDDLARAGVAARAEPSRRGMLVGTPAYMAPEQLAGEEGDTQSDQFSFCVSLYEALSGARPFTGASVDELRASMAREPAAPPGARLAPHVRAALARGLSFERSARFASVDALLDALSAPEDALATTHIQLNAAAQLVMCILHITISAFLVWALVSSEAAADEALDVAAAMDSDPDPPALTAASFGLTALLFSGWLPLGAVWTAANAWGLWRRRTWALWSSILYAAVGLLTCVGVPYGVYGIFSLTLPRVRAFFSSRPSPGARDGGSATAIGRLLR